MDLAIKIGCPVIGINDSGGARVQDAVTSLAMYSEIGRRQYPLSGLSPADLHHARQVRGRCCLRPRHHRLRGGH
ncbi:MAG: carboxyl transferase domain-containing protein [Lawsonella clevelandensis]